MNKSLILILSVASILIIGSCKSKQIPIDIINLNKAQGLRNYSNIYSLPKTVVKIKVTVEREKYARGPYYQYAQSYLGLSDVIQEDQSKYRISEVEFNTYPISDTNNVYLIETNNEEQLLQFQINKDGFVESINEKEENILSNNQQLESKEIQDKGVNIYSTNIELHGNKDISFDDIPVPKEILSKRIVSEQASSLANKILVLRDDRAALLVGDGYTQALPVGETMRTMIDEIDKALESYESMFKGKIVTETFTYFFDFVRRKPERGPKPYFLGFLSKMVLSIIPTLVECRLLLK